MKNELPYKFTTLFEKQRKAAPREIKKAFLETIALFIEDHNHPSLRNHALKEKFAGYRSIDVTHDWRALFKEKTSSGQAVITFHRIATHKDLYG